MEPNAAPSPTTPEPAPATVEAPPTKGAGSRAVAMADLADLERAMNERFARVEAQASQPAPEPDDLDDLDDEPAPHRAVPGWLAAVVFLALAAVGALVAKRRGMW